MTKFERDYIELVEEVFQDKNLRDTRNGETYSIFAKTLQFDCNESFPILQGRKIFYKGVFGELAAMFNEPKHIDDFKSRGCNYWDAWAKPDGSINLDYGNKWMNWNGVNQVNQVLTMINSDPTSRRMLISGWDPSNLENLDLPCCHYAYQFYVDGDDLHMIWTQRSVDVMVGLPADAVLAGLWLELFAEITGKTARTVTMNFGDTHIYKAHNDKVREYLLNSFNIPKSIPKLQINIIDLKSSMILDYECLIPIKFDLVV